MTSSSWSVVARLALLALLAGCEFPSDAEGPHTGPPNGPAPPTARADGDGPDADAPDAGAPDAARRPAPPADPAALPLDSELLAWTPPTLDDERRRTCAACPSDPALDNEMVRRVRITRTVGRGADGALLARAESLWATPDPPPCDLHAPAVPDDAPPGSDVAFPLAVGTCGYDPPRFLLWRLLLSLGLEPATGAWPADALPSCPRDLRDATCGGCERSTSVTYDAVIERVPGEARAGDLGPTRSVLAGDPETVLRDAQVARIEVSGYGARTAAGRTLTRTVVFDASGAVVLVGGSARQTFALILSCRPGGSSREGQSP